MSEWTEVTEIPRSKRILFLGDSITENGTYIRDLDAVFTRLLPQCGIEWIGLGVSSETAAGTHEITHPFPRPDVHERLDRALAETRPDWVFVCYGMNDGIYHPFARERFDAYRSGMERMVAKIEQAGAQPILLTPPPFDILSVNGRPQPEGLPDYSFDDPYGKYDEVLGFYSDWLLAYGREKGLKTVDIRRPLHAFIEQNRERNPDFRYGDGVHPDEAGHAVIAHTILKKVFRLEWEQMPEWLSEDGEFLHLVTERRELLKASWREHVGHSNPYKLDALPLGEALKRVEELLPAIREAARREGGELDERLSDWNGLVRRDYKLNGRSCLVVEPRTPADGRPWIWRTEFFGDFANADLELARLGWHIGYIGLSHLYGSPFAAREMEVFRSDAARRFDLASKPVLFGFSRGGLYAVRYAETFPQHTRALYLDAPVVDIASWPGGFGAGHGSPEEWEDCLDVYGIPRGAYRAAEGTGTGAAKVTDELLEMLAVPARAGIPILLVAGGADEAVPFAENGEILARRYLECGGVIEQIVKPDCGHHPHGLEHPQPVVDFVRSSPAK
ncbi:GDSL-type esterase/lipase family protein [Saccharibacillus sp. CPCC 101409]|uniref:GDSL-type esterase/lipase family protein n=1 Tax=Saccharibacillus sp. CPCC 101409 TaxID=3058041 RepID=UPI00267186E5|nr:GDSL-type esterase/lipase family protein [Saccharibacillus sp. CPCC 101409]MDO3411757.1 GDSL-type esterase/lipase family protein [Saccharibacillus sp. CPCC 101409]